MEFFQISVTIWCLDEDRQDLTWLFPQHTRVSSATGSEDSFDVLVHAEGGFFHSLFARDSVRKTVATQGTNDAFTVHSFNGWSGQASPIPPFTSSAFKSNYLLFPGAVLTSPRGEVIALSGANHVGKTSTAIALLEIGWELNSESLVIMNCNTGLVEGYFSAFGMRRETLTKWEERTERLATRQTYSEVTGRVRLVRAEDVFPGQVDASPRALDGIFFLTDDEVDPAHRTVQTDLRKLRVYPLSQFAKATSLLPTHIIQIATQDPERNVREIQSNIELLQSQTHERDQK